MKIIKIISGTYGYQSGGRIIPKSRKDEAFEIDDKEAERLVSMGVAEFVTGVVATAPGETFDNIQTSNTVFEENVVIGENESGAFDEEKLRTMTNAELKELAGSMGVDISKAKNKNALIAAILNDAMPTLTAEDVIG